MVSKLDTASRQNPLPKVASGFDLFDTLPTATIIYTSEHKFLYANAAFCRLSGMQPSELFDRTLEQLQQHFDQLEVKGSDIRPVGSFGAQRVAQDGLRYLEDGRILEILESELRLDPFGEVRVQQWIDHTSVGRAFREIESEFELLLKLINQVPDQIYFKDLESRFTRINPALAQRYKIDSASQAIGKSDADFYSAEHAEITRREELEMMRTGEPVFNQLYQEIWEDGSESWNLSTKMPIYNADGEVVGIAGISHDITEHKRREEDAWQQANYDGLTQLANRSYFLKRLRTRIELANSERDRFAVMLLDLDRFKEVNDTLGHSQGDLLLQQIAQRISQAVRDVDFIGRLGGDEFAVIAGVNSADQLEPLLQRMLTEIEKPMLLKHERVSVSASIGIALFPDDAATADELLSRADEAMYHVKDRGRSGYSHYNVDLSAATKRRLRLASDLRSAIGTDQICLVYQPVVAANYERIVGAEALCRWNHPVLGAIAPSEFIPLAERTGLIQRLEDSILDSVLAQLVQINTGGFSPVRLSVNISPRRIMRDPTRLKALVDELDRLGIFRSQLVIEVTEGLLLEATPEVLGLFKTLCQQGILISLDDFGTGYCALSYLMDLDIHQVKIDRSFVERVDTDASSQALCASIISLARTLGLSVVAEGVERSVQRDRLNELGCDYYQGFLFSQPLAVDEFMTLLQEQGAHEQLRLDALS